MTGVGLRDVCRCQYMYQHKSWEMLSVKDTSAFLKPLGNAVHCSREGGMKARF